MEAVKKANEGNDAAAIQKALDQLTAAQHKAAESLYKQGGAAGAPGPEPAGGGRRRAARQAPAARECVDGDGRRATSSTRKSWTRGSSRT